MDTDEVGGRFGVNHISGEPAVAIGSAPAGGGFAAYSKEGMSMGSLVSPEGRGVFGIHNKEGKPSLKHLSLSAF